MPIYLFLAASLVFVARILLAPGYSPAHLWAYTWALAWGLQAVFGFGYQLDLSTVLFVAVCNFVFIGAAAIATSNDGQNLTEAVKAERRSDLFPGSRLRFLAGVASVALGLVALSLGLRKLGRSGVRGIFNGSFNEFASSLVETKASFADERVWVTPPEISAALLLLTCAAILAGIEAGLVVAERRRSTIALCVAVAAFAFMASAGTGVRGHFLTTAILFTVSYLAAKSFINGQSYKLPTKFFMAGLLLVSSFLIWAVVVQSARLRDLSFSQLGATLDHLRAWFAGYLPALSQWSAETDLPGRVFSGEVPVLAAGALGPLGVGQGEAFTEKVGLAEIGDGATTNAMTLFRVLLLDFGYAGTLVACAVAGFVAQRIYIKVVSGATWAIVPLVGLYASVLWSFNYWFFARGSRVSGLLLALIVVLVSMWLSRPARSADRDSAKRVTTE